VFWKKRGGEREEYLDIDSKKGRKEKEECEIK